MFISTHRIESVIYLFNIISIGKTNSNNLLCPVYFYFSVLLTKIDMMVTASFLAWAEILWFIYFDTWE